MASQPIYEFYAELLDYKPKIWRRFQVPQNITVARLGYILMSMFEMQASHLFCFDVPYEENFINYLKQTRGEDYIDKYFSEIKLDKSRHYELIDEDSMDYRDEDEKIFEASEHKIKDVLSTPNDKMNFNYDFGDDWNVHVVLEKIFEDKALDGKLLPRIIHGEGYGIIEDCGGVGGLLDLAKAFKKKKGAQYKEFCEWLGRTELDLETFDIPDANMRLKKVPRIYTDIYEYHITPTKQSIDFLERKYFKR